MSKKKKSPSNNYNAEIEYRQLPIGILISTQEYQRKRLNKRIVNTIVNNLNPHKLGVLWVSHRDGKYYVYDGRHRLTALKILYPNLDYFVNCEIHNGLTYEDEARLFAEQHDDKAPLDACQKFNGYLEARDSEANAIEKALNDIGFSVGKDKGDHSNNTIACVNKVTELYRKYSYPSFKAIFKLIKTIWDGDRKSLDRRIVGGMAIFHETYKGDFSEKRLVKVLQNINSHEIIVIGNSDLNASGDLRYAKAIFQKYNYGTKAKLEYKFKG